MKSINGFRLTARETIKEMGADLCTYQHTSGSTLYYIENDDTNKVFGVSFTTPPSDDGGVFHIIEHSVLCGSDKYPVREPFINLAKTSMSTFLNAITYPDKTVYPVASTNEKDLSNLMSVYLDAVFCPKMRTDKRIFMQEGWHYDFDGKNLSINGVVYNEMKGAMSPERISDEAGYKALFPQSPYQYNSGGEPEAIPLLTYEKFLSEYQKHYNAKNAVFFLYGNLDFDEKTAMIDGYLSNMSGGESIEIVKQSPVCGDVTTKYDCGDESEENNAYITLNLVPYEYADYEKIFALSILDDALNSSNNSVLKNAVLESGIAVDFETYVDMTMLQPTYKLMITKTSPQHKDKFLEVIQSTMRTLIEKGMPKDEISASINSLEFSLREDDSGSRPKGLYYFLRILSGRLYAGNPTLLLRYENILKALKEQVNTNYFEKLAQEVFFDCKHRAVVLTMPEKGLNSRNEALLDQKLKEYAQKLSPSERDALALATQEFNEFQAAADSPENLATLPHLELSDLAAQAVETPTHLTTEKGIKVISHPLHTNEITYAHLYFDLSVLTEPELLDAAMLLPLLEEISTENYKNTDIKRRIKANLGEWSAGNRVLTKKNNDYVALLDISYSALPENLDFAVDITDEILMRGVFDQKTVKTVLTQVLENAKQSMRRNGHMTAMRAVRGGLNAGGRITDIIGGEEMLNALTRVIKDIPALCARLKAVATKLFTKSNLTISVTGNYKDAHKFVTKTALPKGKAVQALKVSPKAVSVGFVAPESVNYAARGINLEQYGIAYDSRMQVASRVLDYEYLWNEVRAKGGAYGAGVVVSRSGDLIMYSYRDPEISKTIDAFASCGDFLRNVHLEKSDLDGYIISIISDIDNPVSPRLAGINADAEYLSGITKEDKLTSRNNILSCSISDIHALAENFDKLNEGKVCAVGTKAKIAAYPFERVQNL